MRGAALDRPLRALAGQEPVDRGRRRTSRRRRRGPGSRGPRGVARLVELARRDSRRAPQSLTVAVVALRSVVATTLKFGEAPSRRRSIILRKFCGVEAGEVLVDALHLEAERGREVLLVAEHHVHEGRELRG